jgi:hypothetical protein
MSVEFQVDSLDTVDESLRTAYVEKDGKFTLDVDKYSEFKAQGLKNKNSEIIKKLNAAKDGLKRFERFQELEDDDLAELLELREQKSNPKPDGKPAKGHEELTAQFEKQTKKLADKHTTELTARDARIAELEKENKHFKLTVPLREIALKAGVFPEDLSLAMLETSSRFALNDEGKIVVLDEDGDPSDITPQTFFEKLYKEQRPKFYAASGASGSGASSALGRSTGSKVITRKQYDAMSPTDQAGLSKFFAEGGKIVD